MLRVSTAAIKTCSSSHAARSQSQHQLLSQSVGRKLVQNPIGNALGRRTHTTSQPTYTPSHSYSHSHTQNHSHIFLRTTILATSTIIAFSIQQELQSPSQCDYATNKQKHIPLPTIEIVSQSLTTNNNNKGDNSTKTYWQAFVEQTQHVYQQLHDVARYSERVLTYLLYGLPLAALGPANYLLGDHFPQLQNLTWGYLVWAVQCLGPSFVKMAQWASTRPDIFPPKLIEHFVVLQDDVQIKYPFSVVETTMEKAFGVDWKDKLVLDPKPLGAGSVAQVFQGVLYPNGKSNGKSGEGVKVAVKMIHPHVENMILVDMELMNIFVAWLDSFPSLEILSLADTARQFADSMNAQMDLRKEASHLVKFAKKFAHEEWAVFPQPLEGFVTKNVLVETLMLGTPISHYMALSDDVALKLKRQLSDLGTRLVLKMIFFDNFIHGDLHPGNLLVQFNAKGVPRLIVLDCGIIYSSKSDSEHEKLVDICLAFMQHDGVRAGKLMIDNAQAKSAVEVKNQDEFCTAIQKIVTDSEKENYFEHMGEYLTKICDLARDHSVKFDPGYFKIAMALKVAEGIALALDRELDLISKCIPILMKARTLRKLGIQKFPEPEPDDDFMDDTHRRK